MCEETTEKCKEIGRGLLVSSSTCKELGSHHSVLTTGKKQNRLKKSTLLGSIREGRTNGKLLPPRLEKKANTQLPGAENTLGASVRVGKAEL